MTELQEMLKRMSTKELIEHWRASATVAFSSPADDPTIQIYWNVLDQVTVELNVRRLARQRKASAS